MSSVGNSNDRVSLYVYVYVYAYQHRPQNLVKKKKNIEKSIGYFTISITRPIKIVVLDIY